MTDSSAKTTPSRMLPLGARRLTEGSVAALGETTKHATTNPTRAKALIRLVTSCARLPARSPSQFTTVKTTTHPIETSFKCGARPGCSPAENSPKATDRYEIATICSTQSQQPTRNPAYFPKLS